MSLGAGDVRVPIFLASGARRHRIAQRVVRDRAPVARVHGSSVLEPHGWRGRQPSRPCSSSQGVLALWSNQRALIWLLGLAGAGLRLLSGAHADRQQGHSRVAASALFARDAVHRVDGGRRDSGNFSGFPACDRPPALAAVLLALLLTRVICWRAYLSGLRADGAPQGTLRALQTIDAPLVAIGHVIPAALIIASWAAAPAGAGTGSAIITGVQIMIVVAGLLAVGSGWALKYTIVRRAAFTQGFALPHLPVRGSRTVDLGTKPGWSRVDQAQQ